MARIMAGMKPLGELLREWRDGNGYSASEAARKCDLTPQMWWALETGYTTTPRPATMQKLVEGTGIALERLAVASYFAPAAEAAPVS